MARIYNNKEQKKNRNWKSNQNRAEKNRKNWKSNQSIIDKKKQFDPGARYAKVLSDLIIAKNKGSVNKALSKENRKFNQSRINKNLKKGESNQKESIRKLTGTKSIFLKLLNELDKKKKDSKNKAFPNLFSKKFHYFKRLKVNLRLALKKRSHEKIIKNEFLKIKKVKSKDFNRAGISRKIKKKSFFNPKSWRNLKQGKSIKHSIFLAFYKPNKFVFRNTASKIIFKFWHCKPFKDSDALWTKFKKTYLVGNNLFWFLFFFKSFYFLAFRVSFSLWVEFLRMNLLDPKINLASQLVNSGYLELYEKKAFNLFYHVEYSYIYQKDSFFSSFDRSLLSSSYFLKRAVLFFDSFSLIDLKFYEGFFTFFNYPKYYLFPPFFKISKYQRYVKKSALAWQCLKRESRKQRQQKNKRKQARVNGGKISVLKTFASELLDHLKEKPKNIDELRFYLLPYKERKRLESEKDLKYKPKRNNYGNKNFIKNN